MTVTHVIIRQVFLSFVFLSVMSSLKIEPACEERFMYYKIMDNPFLNQCNFKNQWILWKRFEDWRPDDTQLLLTTFPIDPERRNYVRQVKEALFSVVTPLHLKSPPVLIAVSEDTLMTLLDLEPDSMVQDLEFLEIVSGNKIFPGSTPLSHRYGGHQFGYWSGQLGDGRAVMLGEYVNWHGERWELQLKGSGLTPYSRRGDGRAVLRSSVREFLCSEAMFGLGIPTSRAASLVVSDDPVIRDQFYNGNIQREKTAVVLRLAKSWFRIGSLEILKDNNEIGLLRQVTDFIIEEYFPFINLTDSNRFLAFFQEVVNQTASMIALWQSVGFTHGVCNTDNFSILSITIDYGPFGFMEKYNPKFVPNTSDDEGRYSFGKQPDVGLFNLDKLRIAILPLVSKPQKKQLLMILKGYEDIYKRRSMELFRQKLGLVSYDDSDGELVAVLFKIMEDTESDFTMTFRELSKIDLSEILNYATNDNFPEKFWCLPLLASHEWFQKWLQKYIQRLRADSVTETVRQRNMKLVNPRYVLRNWMAQSAIDAADAGDYSVVRLIHKILRNPFIYQPDAETKGYSSKPPGWAKHLRVSCSS